MALELQLSGTCPACGSEAVWRGVGVAGDTEYTAIDCDVCDMPTYTFREQVQRWRNRKAS